MRECLPLITVVNYQHKTRDMTDAKNQTLPIGYMLQDYIITKVLSTGGFSFVYLAKDVNKHTVAIKEYMPTGLALREDGATVMLDSEDDEATFKHGLKCFFEEGLALAKIDHRNIIRVTNFFRENNTVNRQTFTLDKTTRLYY